MAVEPKELRATFGQFSTGVCVASCVHDGQPIGMTINSLSSVSLAPALLQWNIQKDSDCFDAFIQAEQFSISVLTEQQQQLSNRYAQKGGHLLSGEDLEHGSQGLPIIAGALATFECQRWAVYPGGDHEIIIGAIQSTTRASEAKPLLFYAGKYRTLRD